MDRKGDYLLALKDNHPTLREAVVEEFIAAMDADSVPAGVRRHVTVEENRGRAERREYVAMPAPKSLPGFADWAGLTTLVMVCRITLIDRRSQLLSVEPAGEGEESGEINPAAWSIESQLHWVLDVTFTEDASRIRKKTAPQTSAMLRRLAVSILSSDTSLKDTIRGKRYRACLSTDVLERILLGFAQK